MGLAHVSTETAIVKCLAESGERLDPTSYRRLFDSIMFSVEASYAARHPLQERQTEQPRLEIVSSKYGSPFEIVVGLVGATAGLGASVAAILAVLSNRSVNKRKALAEIEKINAEIRLLRAETKKLEIEFEEQWFDAYDRRRYDATARRLKREATVLGTPALQELKDHFWKESVRLESIGHISSEEATAIRTISRSLALSHLDYLAALDEFGVTYNAE